MEQLTVFHSSRGLLRSCDAHNRHPRSSCADLDTDLLRQLRPGASVYVCTEALEAFARDLLAAIEVPFTLVSGDSDVAVDDALLERPALRALLENPQLLAWFAQNLAAHHAKLHALPIGMDYHTMHERPGFWGLSAVSPIAQEHALLATLAASPSAGQRYAVAYCNWHYAPNSADRRACLERVDHALCLFEPRPVPRASTWMRQSEFAFVISPEGVGMDCHRTWEALLLGCIPIVRRGPTARLFDGLPVLILDDWAELSRPRMMEFLATVAAQDYDFSALFRAHWVRRIRAQDAQLVEPMRLERLRHFLTHNTA